jgi:hypothetical protein
MADGVSHAASMGQDFGLFTTYPSHLAELGTWQVLSKYLNE